MLCLYNPYSFNRSAAGGRAVPVRGILFTVFKAWTKTRSGEAELTQRLSTIPHDRGTTRAAPRDIVMKRGGSKAHTHLQNRTS